MGGKKRGRKKSAATRETRNDKTPSPTGGTRLLSGALLALLALIVGGVLAMLESIKATLTQE